MIFELKQVQSPRRLKIFSETLVRKTQQIAESSFSNLREFHFLLNAKCLYKHF